jgi:magnesium-transporting ATPase (P-type)
VPSDCERPILREFIVNEVDPRPVPGDKYCNNRVKTCKYSILTFLPLNLMVQFSKMANCYFLLIVLLSYIPAVYTPGGPASNMLPLAFVIVVSMIKDIVEDRSRYLSDQEENKRLTTGSQLGSNNFYDCEAEKVKFGSIIKVKDDENFPCDIILLNSSLPKGICYVETKGLDGETNLKQKQARSEIYKLASSDSAVFRQFTRAKVVCDLPNP